VLQNATTKAWSGPSQSITRYRASARPYTEHRSDLASRAHPGAALTLFDIEAGFRHTAFLTDTAPGVVAGQVAGLELRQCQHARTEDCIRQAKAAGLRNLPCRATPENDALHEVVLAAADLVAW
jgi:hypothetical protein